MGSVLAAIALLLCFGIGMLLGKIKRPVPLEMAQREYVTIVLPRLVALYGPADDYTPARVDRALRETGADFAHRAYA